TNGFCNLNRIVAFIADFGHHLHTRKPEDVMTSARTDLAQKIAQIGLQQWSLQQIRKIFSEGHTFDLAVGAVEFALAVQGNSSVIVAAVGTLPCRFDVMEYEGNTQRGNSLTVSLTHSPVIKIAFKAGFR